MSEERWLYWTNIETRSFLEVTCADENRRHWARWRTEQVIDELLEKGTAPTPEAVGKSLIDETVKWARQFYGRNATATKMINEVGSFWRVDQAAVGQYFTDVVASSFGEMA